MQIQNKWNRAMIDLVFPRRCPICDEVMPYGAKGICGKHELLPYVTEPTCMKCGKSLDDEELEYCADCGRISGVLNGHIRSSGMWNRSHPVCSRSNITINGNMWNIMEVLLQNGSGKRDLQNGFRSFCPYRFTEVNYGNGDIIRRSCWQMW